MRLEWERPRQGLCRGYTAEGHELAQVAHVYGPSGDDLGWIVWLVYVQGAEFGHYASADAAQLAAEQALTT